jgi:hypothetical protein
MVQASAAPVQPATCLGLHFLAHLQERWDRPQSSLAGGSGARAPCAGRKRVTAYDTHAVSLPLQHSTTCCWRLLCVHSDPLTHTHALSGSCCTRWCRRLRSQSLFCSTRIRQLLVGLDWAETVLLRCQASAAGGGPVLQSPDKDALWYGVCAALCPGVCPALFASRTTDLLQECSFDTAGCPVLA